MRSVVIVLLLLSGCCREEYYIFHDVARGYYFIYQKCYLHDRILTARQSLSSAKDIVEQLKKTPSGIVK